MPNLGSRGLAALASAGVLMTVSVPVIRGARRASSADRAPVAAPAPAPEPTPPPEIPPAPVPVTPLACPARPAVEPASARESTAALVPPARPHPPGQSDPESFRPDVEGLRGVAILLVLLFHGAMPVPGGFVGVDVFFVISGFLITGMLLREIGRSGGIALDRFYARRIRRLLPAAVVVLAVTLPLAYTVIAPLDRAAAMDDGMAAMLSISNIRFALAEGDYFAAANGPSPFLHFWSLSLEEQFYLFWPLALLLVARGRRANLWAGIALTVVFAVSLGASVAVTQWSATWAFYSLPCRAWQFAAGGLLAIGAGRLARLPSLLVVPGGWAGVGILVASALLLDGSLPYPGLLAVAPTAAAVLLIASGERRRGPGAMLASRPLRFLGRISYSLYLWHWPILLLPAVALGVALEPAANMALVGVSIVVAWASWAFVERRFRYPMAKGTRAPRRSLAMGAVSMIAVVGLAGSLDLAAVGSMSAAVSDDPITWEDPVETAGDLGPVTDGDDTTTLEPEDGPPMATPSPSAGASVLPVPSASTPGSSPAPSPSAPRPTATATPDLEWKLTIPDEPPTARIPLPGDVRPSLAGARRDIERLFADGCITQTSGSRPADCVYGDPHGAITIALVGDSHASHWFPAFNVLATRHGWRLIPYVKVSCPFVDMPVVNLNLKREYTECATWRGRVIERLNEQQPDLIVVASGYRAIIAARSADASPHAQGAAMGRAIAQLVSPVAVMIDTPRVSYDIPACLSKHTGDVRACAMPRSAAFPSQYGVREVDAARATGAGLLDMSAAVCPTTPCQVVRDGIILYRDNHHLTATFARSLAGPLDAALAPFLAPSSPPVADPGTAPERPGATPQGPGT